MPQNRHYVALAAASFYHDGSRTELKLPKRLMFCHCEKTAGTTLIGQLRSILGIRHVDLIPNSLEANEAFEEDVRATLRQLPFALTLAGHSLKPHIDYGLGIAKFTILRDPVDRYFSEYKHDHERRGFSGTFEEWAELRSRWNYQTQFIGGSLDVQHAKEALTNNVAFFGLVERYDEFLALIAGHLGIAAFASASSKPENVSKTTRKLTPAQRALAVKHNNLDIELYEFAKDLYDARVESWMKNCVAERRLLPSFGSLGNIGLRNLYYKPIRGLRPFQSHALPVNAVNAAEAERRLGGQGADQR